MNQKIVKFLKFKGKTMLFLSKDGIYWIAIKSVCEAINVNYNRQFQNLKVDPILGSAFAIQQMQVPGDQLREMICLPEEFIYGWLFSIKSESAELLEYKKECYHILFEYFHGTTTSRKNLIREKALIQHERIELETNLKENPDFLKYEDLKAREARLGIALKSNDKDELRNQQLDMFDDN